MTPESSIGHHSICKNATPQLNNGPLVVSYSSQLANTHLAQHALQEIIKKPAVHRDEIPFLV